jgi:signal transduction histidine kinase
MVELPGSGLSSNIKHLIIEYIIFFGLLFLIYLSSLDSFLLFHTIAELSAIIISVGIFLVGWNSKAYLKTSFFLIIGVSFLFVGIIDLIHTLAYTGMNIFIGFTSNLPTSLWIVARYWQAISFLLALILYKKNIDINYLIIFSIIFLIILIELIFQGLFPVCYIEEYQQLTPFKIISEYIIDSIFVISLIWMYMRRKEFDTKISTYIIISIISMIISELAFTIYTDVYGIANLIGHLFKIIAFYHMYKAIIKTGIKEPYNLLFRKLKLSEEELKIRAERLEDMASFPLENPNPVLRVNQALIMSANKASQEIFNTEEGNLIPKTLQHYIDECFSTSKNMETEIKIGDAVYNFYFMFIEAKGYVNIYGLNITERIKAKQRLERFVATVSHELRNPISVLVTSTDFLDSHSEELTADIIEKLKEGMKKNIYLLKDLVDDILMLSRIDERKITLDLSEVKPLEIIEEILLLMEPIGNQKNMTFKVNVDPNLTIYGDSKRLDQIFRIFIDNAIKYSAKNSMVMIEAVDLYHGHLNKQNIDGVLFTVEDTGIGIAKDDLPNLFKRFFRSDKVSDIPGTGLGLSIAKELIDLHGGSVDVESELMKGTKFSIFLPKIKRL